MRSSVLIISAAFPESSFTSKEHIQVEYENNWKVAHRHVHE